MSKAYIYRITNLINDKVYIGFTKNLRQRHFSHFKHNRSKPKYLLGKAIQKYGPHSFVFDVLYENDDIEHTKSIMEPLFIACYNSHYQSGHGYNMTDGGDGVTHDSESRKKIGEAAKLRLAIRNNGALKSRKDYIAHFADGSNEPFNGLSEFCRTRNYSITAMKLLMKNQRKYHKDIIKLERVE